MKNKTILITGANGNLGSYFTEQLIKKNNLILLVYGNYDNHLSHLQNVRVIEANIIEYNDLQEKINNVLKETNWQLEIIIHTAAERSSDFQSVSNSNIEKWQHIIQTNIFGTYHLLKVIIPILQKHQYGRILLLGSNVSRKGLPFGSAYASSKAAIANFCRSVAAEIAKDNILINTISPGPIKIDDSHFSESYRKFRENYYRSEKKNIPLKRICTMDDVFHMSMFLLSDNNTYMTGEEIFLTGGSL